MNFFILFLLGISSVIFAQDGKFKTQEIYLSLDNLKSFQPPFDTTFVNFTKDAFHHQIEIKLNCESWAIIYPEDSSKNFVFNQMGEIIANEQFMLKGYCFCSSCSKKLRTLNLSEKNTVLLKMMNCKGNHEITAIENTIAVKQKWHERNWKKGEKINLENLLFYPNRSMFLSESFEELEELFLLLEKQKNLSISIMGHVNGPDSKNTDEFQMLSENRAKAVYDYLIKKGIPVTRLSYKGFGNTQMVYPKPQSEEQMRLNRRVEIIIQ